MTDFKKVELKVSEGYVRDAGRGVARIDFKTLHELGFNITDTRYLKLIAAHSRKHIHPTYVKGLPLYPGDEGKNIITMDGNTRYNLSVEINDNVIVQKINEPNPATNIIIRPVEPIPFDNSKFLADTIESLVVTKDDRLVVPYFAGRLLFKVLSYSPDDSAVIISKSTNFEILKYQARSIENHIRDLYNDLNADGYRVNSEEENFIKDLTKIVEKKLDDSSN